MSREMHSSKLADSHEFQTEAEQTTFIHDVFLSHSSKDKAVVRELAERLKEAGLRIWFDEWEIELGDSIPVRINEGLHRSRTLVLCMSANAFGAEWATLETQSLLFQDPLNRRRRFVPLRLDDTPAPVTLGHFAYADWRGEKREAAYQQLLEACRGERPKSITPAPELTTGQQAFENKILSLGHTAAVRSVVFSPDGKFALSGSDDNTLRLWDVESALSLRTFEGHASYVWSVSWSPDGRRILSASNDHTVLLWDVASGRMLRTFEGHQNSVSTVSWSPDGSCAISGSHDYTMRLWDIDAGDCVRTFQCSNSTLSVSWSPDGRRILSCSYYSDLSLWDVESGICLRTFEGHSFYVNSVSWSPDGRHALSGSADKTLRLWDVDTGRCLRTFEGHTERVWSVSWSPDGCRALSGSADKTLRLWDVDTGRCLRTFEGHTDYVNSVSWSPDGHHALSGSNDNTLRLWDIDTGRCLRMFGDHEAWISLSIEPLMSCNALGNDPHIENNQLQYTNAKVLFVGESAAGKTGLSNRLAHHEWIESPGSTVGAWATQWPLPVTSTDGVQREIWLWDFGGQADQRLIHQLYMDQAALAVLVFDGGKPHLFESLGQWDRDLCKASSTRFEKLLVAGRVDASVVRVDREQLREFARLRGFRDEVIETSAKTGQGCEELRQAIEAAIPWDQLTTRSTLTIFKRLKDEIVKLKDEGRVLMRFKELRDALTLRLWSVGFRSAKARSDDVTSTTPGLETENEERAFAERKPTLHFTDEQLATVITLLEGPGVVWELGFGSWILLQPERINACAQAVIQTMSQDPQGLGCISEEQVLNCQLRYADDVPKLDGDEERIIRMAMHAALVDRDLCWQEGDPNEGRAKQLVFPSYFRRNRPDPVSHPAVFVSYEFSGFLDDIYATLVVRLHHTDAFERDQLWNMAADFKTQTGQQLGVKMNRLSEGAGELLVYFDPLIPTDLKLLFAKFVHEHLKTKVRDIDEIKRLRHYVCPHCHTPVGNREVAMKKLAEGKKTIVCVNCEKRVPLWDELEDRFASDDLREVVRRENEHIDFAKDVESKERLLVGEVISTVALAGQISREITVSDHGIDMGIEFKNDAGEATGKKVLLQLKSGDSHLTHRERDNVDVFAIKKPRHVEYWMEQAHPVLLVVRNSTGHIRCMEIREHLREAPRTARSR